MEIKRKLLASELDDDWYCNVDSRIVAQLLDVQQPRISALKKAGMPCNKDGSFNLATIVSWIRQKADSKKTPLAEQKTMAEIELLRAKIANLQDTTMLKTDHRDAVTKLISSVKDFWLSGCRKIAPDFINCPDAITAQNILTQFVQHGLNTIAGKR